MQTIILGLLICFAPPLTAVDSAVIVDSGSTNSAGFQVEVSRSSGAVYTPKPRRATQLSEELAKPRKRQVPAPLIKRFFADLEAAGSLPSLPRRGCMKSASFGTTLTVEYRGQQTPDLRCGDRGNPTLQSLIQSTDEIVKLFGAE